MLTWSTSSQSSARLAPKAMRVFPPRASALPNTGGIAASKPSAHRTSSSSSLNKEPSTAPKKLSFLEVLIAAKSSSTAPSPAPNNESSVQQPTSWKPLSAGLSPIGKKVDNYSDANEYASSLAKETFDSHQNQRSPPKKAMLSSSTQTEPRFPWTMSWKERCELAGIIEVARSKEVCTAEPTSVKLIVPKENEIPVPRKRGRPRKSIPLPPVKAPTVLVKEKVTLNEIIALLKESEAVENLKAVDVNTNEVADVEEDEESDSSVEFILTKKPRLSR
jgi:hypothetical protein